MINCLSDHDFDQFIVDLVKSESSFDEIKNKLSAVDVSITKGGKQNIT